MVLVSPRLRGAGLGPGPVEFGLTSDLEEFYSSCILAKNQASLLLLLRYLLHLHIRGTAIAMFTGIVEIIGSKLFLKSFQASPRIPSTPLC